MSPLSSKRVFGPAGFSMPDLGSMDRDAYSEWTRGFFTKFKANRPPTGLSPQEEKA